MKVPFPNMSLISSDCVPAPKYEIMFHIDIATVIITVLQVLIFKPIHAILGTIWFALHTNSKNYAVSKEIFWHGKGA